MTSLQFSENPVTNGPMAVRRQLLNHMVDGISKARPNAVWAEIPKSVTSYASGYRRITYQNLANAVNGVAWWLYYSLGPGIQFETLAYFGPWDVRYVILLLGAVKAGYKMLFPSPNYSDVGLATLLSELQCKTILLPSAPPPIVSTILAQYPLTTIDVPTVEALLDDVHPHFPFDKTFEVARHEPLVVLHTSGTTGHPKSILWTHEYGASLIHQNQLAPPTGYESVDKLYQGNRLLALLPAFHAGNLFGNLFTAIANQTTVVYPLHDAILNAKTLVNILEHVQVDVAVSSPKVVEVLASDSAMLEFVSSKIGALGYAGGNISNAAGCTLASSLKLFSVYAQTENGINATIRPAYSWGEIDWGCLHFHPQAGYEFRHIVNEEFELVIVRKSNPTEEQPVFKVFPHLQEWSTKDVFIPDVARPGGWIYRSRADDIINFNDGTTFNPVVFEQHVNGYPDIRDSVMLGTQRPQASLLIELNSPRVLSESERTDVINDIWPLVSKANAECTKQSTIPRSHIMFTLPEKPLPRASKGTVQRALAVKLYAEELHALY